MSNVVIHPDSFFSQNPMATIFAWSGALKRRGELDGLADLVRFGERLESASLQTLEDGVMTKDLLPLVEPGFQARGVDSELHSSGDKEGMRWKELHVAQLVQQPEFLAAGA